jgi:hypothetical protein
MLSGFVYLGAIRSQAAPGDCGVSLGLFRPAAGPAGASAGPGRVVLRRPACMMVCPQFLGTRRQYGSDFDVGTDDK